MKKRLTLALSLVLAVSLIGCGKAVPETSVSNEPAVSAEVSDDVIASTENPENKTEENKTEVSVSEPEKPEEPKEEDPVVSAPAVALKEIFAEHGLKVGTCITPQMISTNKHANLILEQFSSVTAENAMKPDYMFDKNASIEAGDLVVKINSDALKILKWAKENGMAVRGHTLVWYSQTPKWIFYEDFDAKKELASREVMLGRMESYIKQIFEKLTEEGYIDIIYAYDVVNEAWMENGSMRECLWQKTIGDDYLWYAFYYADKYAPESIDLYYNDYNEQYKGSTLKKFVETLKDKNGRYLIDGIGLQAHLYTEDNLENYLKTVDDLASTGLKLQLTELDVCLGAWQKKIPANDENFRKQGKYYYKLINGLFERIDNGTLNMDALTFWGFMDSLSWRSESKPLLYDSKLSPKYSYYGAAQLPEYAGVE